MLSTTIIDSESTRRAQIIGTRVTHVDDEHIYIDIRTETLEPEHFNAAYELIGSNRRRGKIILDCSTAGAISHPAVDLLAQFAQEMKRDEKDLILMVHGQVLEVLRGQNIDTMVKSIVEFNFLDVISEPNFTFTAQLLEVFASVVVQVIHAHTEINPVYLPEEKDKPRATGFQNGIMDEDYPTVDWAGVCHFETLDSTGSILVSFSLKSFLKICSKIMEVQYDSLCEENYDWGAELTNVISRTSVKLLEKQGVTIVYSLPANVKNSDELHRIRSQYNNRWVLSFTYEGEPLYLELMI